MSSMAAASRPVYAEYAAANFVSASGVAIFHVKSSRVVLCYHTRDKYWFLPKGRRDAGESYTRAAEREGFEEVRRNACNQPSTMTTLLMEYDQSGYRNRLLPLSVEHRQPQAAAGAAVQNVLEPLWTSLMPFSRRTQYLIHWYAAETLPPDLEASIGPPPASREYQEPAAYPTDLKLRDRLALEMDGYKPPRYENTGVDSEEALYMSDLIPIDEAVRKLGQNCMSKVVTIGWERIQARLQQEQKTIEASS